MTVRAISIRFLALVVAFFALYALTAQRGLGWGDSGEFQYRILQCPDGILNGCDSFATAHPLYISFARLLCHTPFQITLLSALFGALAVGGLFLLTRSVALSFLFGLSHMLWWLSCITEVQTMNLAFIVLETILIFKFLDTDKPTWLIIAAFVTGLHLNCHNFALLAAPAFAYLFTRASVKAAVCAYVAGCLGAAYWLLAILALGPQNVLVGSYGAQVSGLLPSDLLITGFNIALSSMSFAVPAILAWLGRGNRTETIANGKRTVLWILFVTHGLFFIRYFVQDQAMFLLPTLLFAFLLVSRTPIKRTSMIILTAVQLFLPVLVYLTLSQLPTPESRTKHPYRNDATYFALPWKFHDSSADKCAAEHDGPWNGYTRD